MARDNYRKVKLIKLLDLLRQGTDEQHPMTNNQVCVEMERMGIPCDRRIITQDVAVLNDLGYDDHHDWSREGLLCGGAQLQPSGTENSD